MGGVGAGRGWGRPVQPHRWTPERRAIGKGGPKGAHWVWVTGRGQGGEGSRAPLICTPACLSLSVSQLGKKEMSPLSIFNKLK